MTDCPSPVIRQLMPRRIAVFRALYLGDMLCCVPALRAIRKTLPDSEITLVSLPWARDFAKRFDDLIDDFIAFPGGEDFESFSSEMARASFFSDMQSRRFDLAIQLHGSGEQSNDIVYGFGARATAGFVTGHPSSPWYQPYPSSGHEISRLLDLVKHLGCVDASTDLSFPLKAHETKGAQLLLEGIAVDRHGYVVIHPGAKLASRRWGIERYAAVAGAVHREGLSVLLTGTGEEAPLTAAICRQVPEAHDLAGRTDIGTLAAIVGGARLVISNDTGVSHIASALRTPSVIIASGSDVERWAPLNRQRHHTLFADAPCRPCNFKECPYEGHPCARDVPINAVTNAALVQLRK